MRGVALEENNLVNSRERVRKAIRFEEPDRIPIDVGGSLVTGICIDAYVDLVKYLGLDLGLPIVYDQFGMYFMTSERRFLPSDNERIWAVKEQIKRGTLKHILISQDVGFKVLLTKWGGHGYAHILENIVPRLLEEGVTEEQIHTILVENPKRLLSW